MSKKAEVKVIVENEATKEFEINGAKFKLNKIPAGSYFQSVNGSDKDTEYREVEIPHDYYAGTTPVTQAQYEAIMGVNPSYNKASGDHPVESVNWFDAIKFCNALSIAQGLEPYYEIIERDNETEIRVIDPERRAYRLPTEHEWEYAAASWMSPDGRYGELDEIAWTRENSGGTTQAVGQKKPNMFGLYDMLGNVWEWCWDWYSPDEY